MNGKHVVIVDGNHMALGLMEQWLAAKGYDVVSCVRFEDAKLYLARHTPDVLLTEVRLGAYNGLQLAWHVKHDHPEVSVIVFFEYDDPVLRAEADRCGAHFVRTPDSSAALLACLDGQSNNAQA